MSRLAVLIPTHDHGPLLRRAAESALSQTVADLDVVILGDGVDPVTRRVAEELAEMDPRVSFLDRPKGPRLGEIHRHGWLTNEVSAPSVCYLSDDDLLLPHHVEMALAALREVDFVAPVASWIRIDGSVACEPGDMSREDFRRWLVTGPRTTFGLSGVAHTVEAYRRLPHGWRTTPAGFSTDHYMWSQWAEQPGLLARTLTEPTVVHLPSPPRRDWTLEQRVAELDQWVARSSSEASFPAHFRAETWMGLDEAAVNLLIRERWFTLAAEHETALRLDAERWNVDLQAALERALADGRAAHGHVDQRRAEVARLTDELVARDETIIELQRRAAQVEAARQDSVDAVDELHGHLGRVRAAEDDLRDTLQALEGSFERRAGRAVRRVTTRFRSRTRKWIGAR